MHAESRAKNNIGNVSDWVMFVERRMGTFAIIAEQKN